jgi:hypothetical protein
MDEFTSELWASYAEGQAFEGDMARLAQVGPVIVWFLGQLVAQH